MEINKTAEDAFQNAKSKGFHEKQIEIGTRLMLIVSELSEALEANRAEKMELTTDEKKHIEYLMDSEGHDIFKLKYKEHFGFEVADALIRILEMSRYLNLDIEWYTKIKMKYNSTREKMHGGKAY